ncbi:phosphatidylinositol transfer protein, variant [Capsaspora owczarzaki ATCC 30864]|nr:phosphatidylinositol transfer protein, variant [Capsaspora owczarzaki ATCC 30864]
MTVRHTEKETQAGTEVEVVVNEAREHPELGPGHYTEKRYYLASKFPGWLAAIVPSNMYLCEKSWNCYPKTLTETTASFCSSFYLRIETLYTSPTPTEEAHQPSPLPIDVVDIVRDDYPKSHYLEAEDPHYFTSIKTGRGPLREGWCSDPVIPKMLAIKRVSASFAFWGLQTKVESFTHQCLREIFLVGHRQAFAWIDEWIELSEADVREYEEQVLACATRSHQSTAETHQHHHTAPDSLQR